MELYFELFTANNAKLSIPFFKNEIKEIMY